MADYSFKRKLDVEQGGVVKTKRSNTFERVKVKGKDDTTKSSSHTSSTASSDEPRPRVPIQQITKELNEEDNNLRNQATKSLQRASKLKDLRHYNRLILDMGNTRNLFGYTKRAYRELIECGLRPNSYTFANILNACARASAFDDCEEYLGEMTKYDIPRDEVIYTILIKCYINDLDKCMALLNEMTKNQIYPNIRTYNTIIREALQQNNQGIALQAYHHLKSVSKLQPSTSILEFMCKLAAMSYDIAKAVDYYNILNEQYQNANENTIIGGDKKRNNYDSSDESSSDSDSDSDSESSSGSKKKSDPANINMPQTEQDMILLPYNLASCALIIAKACFSLNDVKTGRRLLLNAKNIVDLLMKNKSAQWWKYKRARGGARAPPSDDDKEKRGYSRTPANKSKDEEDEATSARRVAFEQDIEFTSKQFLATRQNELFQEVQQLEKWINQVAHQQHTTAPNLMKIDHISNYQWKVHGVLSQEQGLTLSHRVIKQSLIEEYINQSSKKSRSKNALFHPENNTIDWQRLFRNTNPICIEVGSGTGEWICNRAKLTDGTKTVASLVKKTQRKTGNDDSDDASDDGDTKSKLSADYQHQPTNWIAIEISPIRVHQIYTRMLLENITNLIILQCDARIAFQHAFSPKSVQQIYVNFPQPPWWSKWPYRLLDHQFFRDCHRVLVKSRQTKRNTMEDHTDDRYGMCGEGFITIVTDDNHYTYLLLRELFHEKGNSYNMFTSLHYDGENFATRLPIYFGSSFYHRFWAEGHKFRRFYFKLGKNNKWAPDNKD